MVLVMRNPATPGTAHARLATRLRNASCFAPQHHEKLICAAAQHGV